MPVYLTITADGGYEVKFYETGTDVELVENDWITLTPVGETNMLNASANDTGKVRKADMAIYGAPVEPLFRCTVIQAAE